MADSKIELFFLKNLLFIALIGVCIILASDLILTSYDTNSLIIDTIILVSVSTSIILLKTNHYKTSVVTITTVPLAAECFQATQSPNSIVPMTVILTIGFAFSILLRGRILWIMQIATLIGLVVIFSIQMQNPGMYMKGNANELITIGITYVVLYILVVLSAGTLKARYDQINRDLKSANHELIEKTNEIEAQNEELIQSQEKLNSLNQFLEQTVEDRTKKLTEQSEQLVKYAYTNAHHVRGPIARVLGLVQLYKVDPEVDLQFILHKIEHETNEIDSIISRINVELEKSSKVSHPL
jgi:signal transduction histidine kinase